MDFIYQLKKEDLLGWENVNAEMVAQDASLGFDYVAPIPEPTTMALLGIGGLAALLSMVSVLLFSHIAPNFVKVFFQILKKCRKRHCHSGEAFGFRERYPGPAIPGL